MMTMKIMIIRMIMVIMLAMILTRMKTETTTDEDNYYGEYGNVDADDEL